jgi:hypothetical protein
MIKAMMMEKEDRTGSAQFEKVPKRAGRLIHAVLIAISGLVCPAPMAFVPVLLCVMRRSRTSGIKYDNNNNNNNSNHQYNLNLSIHTIINDSSRDSCCLL